MIKKAENTSRAPFKKKEGPTAVDVHVGQQIRLVRNLLGLTQEDTAQATGLTFQQIQKYEQGKNRVSASRLLQLCKVFNVEPNYFFEALIQKPGTPGFVLSEEQAPYKPRDILGSRETIELLRAYYSISDTKKRKNILTIIRQMSDQGGDK
jgi:transcriptional regulator with XRE-family HTH domain